MIRTIACILLIAGLAGAARADHALADHADAGRTAPPAAPIPDAVAPWTAWPTVTVPAAAPGTETLAPRLVWRLDCADPDLPLIGRISAAAPAGGGRVLLVDRQLAHVLVVSPDGRIERVLGERGEGPGEVRGIHRAVALADGRIGMVGGTEAPTFMLGGRGELVFLDPAGDPAGVWRVAGESGHAPLCTVRELRAAPPHLLVASIRTLVSPERGLTNLAELALVSAADGAREVIARHVWTHAFTREPVAEELAFEAFADGRCDVDASGRIAFAPERDRWLVCIREDDGGGRRLVRPWEQARRTEAQYAAAERRHGIPRDLVLDHEPAAGRVRWRPDGHLWVEPGGWTPAGEAVACFDELTPGGELVRRVRITLPDHHRDDRLLLLENGRLVVLRGFGRVDAGGAGAADGAVDADLGPEVLLLTL